MRTAKQQTGFGRARRLAAFFLPAAVLAGAMAGSALARTQESGEAGLANVNARYVVEAIAVEPVGLARLSPGLRDRVQTLVGGRFDQQLLDELGSLIRREMTNWDVTMNVSKGTAPEHLRVTFDVKRRAQEVKLTLPRLVYHSKQNFSFGLDTGFRHGAHTVRAGVLSDNDERVERFSGVRGGYELALSERVRVGANAETWRSQWNPATEEAVAPGSAAGTPGIYRTRNGLSPFAEIDLLGPSNKFARSLTLQLGVSFERLQMQYPAVRNELSSAAIGTLRFQRRWEVSSSRTLDVDASYGTRIGTASLGGDFGYSRHHWQTRATLQEGRHQWIATAQAGRIGGQAPLYERFVLGNSQTLRGWNRFELTPYGASRMAHGSIEYRYRLLRAIYDTGSAWQAGTAAKVRHSAAIGVTSGGTMQISALVAFPIRDGAIEPVFITGLYF
ncbi:MAG: BamA/TamA family outer membrane protein [Bryobacteraceae bacterium]